MLFDQAARHGRRTTAASKGEGDAFGRTDTNAPLMTALENLATANPTFKESTFIAAKEFLSPMPTFPLLLCSKLFLVSSEIVYE